jgi:hypothetical protein
VDSSLLEHGIFSSIDRLLNWQLNKHTTVIPADPGSSPGGILLQAQTVLEEIPASEAVS